MTVLPRLLGLATAVPPHILYQSRVREESAGFFGREGAHLLPVFDNAGIEKRHSAMPIEWYLEAHGWAERNDAYLATAVPLVEEVALAALAQAKLSPEDIDAIVIVSNSGVATPSLDARLMARLPFRRHTVRLPIFGLGCAGGVLGLSRATALARAEPGSRVLLLVVELSSLSFRKADSSKSNIVATALFADGAAAAIVSTHGEGPALGPSGEHCWPDTLGIMGWDIADDGMKAIFSRDIPSLIRRELRSVVDAFLQRKALDFTDFDRFVCHPGGMKVIAALEEVFERPAGSMIETRDVLRQYGNMSAATVLFVLKATLETDPGSRMLLVSMGPGFSVAFQALDNR
ncbi:MAG: 3-oxoacyl-[acyl-carrier-protein] synthase III C-terminal domain-containing protein [Aliidongia sp.]